MGVGVGEAALSPAAYSMLSDVFPRNRLARAMAVYSIGVPLGAGIAMILGSFVVQAVLAAPAIDLPLIGPVEAWRTIFRSEEHTSELQSLMRISYAVFCLKKKKSTKPTRDQQPVSK